MNDTFANALLQAQHGSRNALTDFIAVKEREFAAYDKRVQEATAKCASLTEKLEKTRRTRRNNATYNELIEASVAAKKELTLLTCEAPDKDTFYEQIHTFLAEQARVAEQQQQQMKNSMTVDTAVEHDNCVAKNGHLHPPSHCSIQITSGAPVFDIRQMHLAFAHMSAKKPLKATEVIDSHSDVASGAQQSFSNTVAMPLLFLLSSVGTGKISQPQKRSLESRGAESNPESRKKLKMVKIGRILLEPDAETKAVAASGERIMPIETKSDLSGAEESVQQKPGSKKKQSIKAKNTRLKIKNKDIRNMQNVSIQNYVEHVEEREKTLEEIQVDNLKTFISKCNSAFEAKKRPKYDDKMCQVCLVALDIDLHTGTVSCPLCGWSHDDGVGDHKWHAIEHVVHTRFEYMQADHCSLLLKHVQAKDTTIVPRAVMDKIVAHITEKKINLDSLTWRKVRSICKKLDLPKYYNHVWKILYLLTKRLVVQFTEVQEAEFLAVFDVLESIYEQFKPSNAENFISYWYFIGKTAQLLGHPAEVLKQFPMLKCPKKHQKKEALWFKMMDHLNWPKFRTPHDSALAVDE